MTGVDVPTRPGSGDDRPRLRVVKGEPTALELAALVAVVTALDAGAATARQGDPSATSGWVRAARDAGLRRGLRAGPGAWRDAVRPGSR